MSTSAPDGARSEDGPAPNCGPGRHRGARQGTAGLRELLRVRAFPVLWSAQILSYLGDLVAQVAVAILVYSRTRSAALTALAYALAYLPPIAGRWVLSGLADFVPPRRLMILTDVIRVALLLAMSLPSTPLAGVCTLLFATVLLGAPHAAARTALAADVLPADRFAQAMAVSTATFQVSQIGGFLVGGALCALAGPRPALTADAAAFALSAALIALKAPTRPRPAPGALPRQFGSALRTGSRAVFARPELRALLLFGCLPGFAVVPEGLAVPYARSLAGGPVTVGLLMSAMPAGMVAGAALIRRLASQQTRLRIMGWLAMLSCAPLAASLVRPPLGLLLPLWVLAGVGAAYQLSAAPAFVRAVPAESRADAFAFAQTGMLAAQGLGVLVAGLVADHVGPQPVVAFAGLLGMSLAGALATSWTRRWSDFAAEVEVQDAADPVRG